MDLIIAPAARLYIKPPIPEPLVAMPAASDRLVVNHCGTIGTEPMNRKPRPRPKQTP